MFTCPNCGWSISGNIQVCPNCNFNFAKQPPSQSSMADKDSTKVERSTSRKEYRQKFKSKEQNQLVKKMIEWIRLNSVIVFLLGLFLLVIMSFSRVLGWLSFLALFIWLLFTCDHTDQIFRYTVDERLTEKIDQFASKIFNKIEHEEHEFSANPRFEKIKAQPKKHFDYVQITVILAAFITLLAMFTGAGAVVDFAYREPMSISKVLLSLANKVFLPKGAVMTAIGFYVIWLLLILFPLGIIYFVFKNAKKDKTIAFVLSLIETVFLFYVIFRLSSITRANAGWLHKITSQVVSHALEVGASTYILLLASLITSGLAGYNLLKKTSTAKPQDK